MCHYNTQGKIVCIEPFTMGNNVVTSVGPPLQNAEKSNVNGVCQSRCFANAWRYAGKLNDKEICQCTKYAADIAHASSGLTRVCEERCKAHEMVYTGSTIQKDKTATLCACSYDRSLAVKAVNLLGTSPSLAPAPALRKDECLHQQVSCSTNTYISYWDPDIQQCDHMCANILGTPYSITPKWENKMISVPANHMFLCRKMSGPNVMSTNDPIVTKDDAQIHIDDNICNQWVVTKHNV